MPGISLLPGYKIWFNIAIYSFTNILREKDNCCKYKDKERQRNPNVQQYEFKVHSNAMENT